VVKKWGRFRGEGTGGGIPIGIGGGGMEIAQGHCRGGERSKNLSGR